MKAGSIRRRLLLSLLPLFVLAQAMIGLATYRSVLAESHALFDYHLRQMALSLRDHGVAAPPPVPGEASESFDFAVRIRNADGSGVYLSRARSGGRLPDSATPGFADLRSGVERWRVYTTVTRGRVIQVGQPFEVRERIAADAAMRSLTPLMVFAPLVALAIWWLIGRSLQPVVRVADDLSRRDARRLDPVAQTDVPAEIAPMIDQLNALLGRLRQAFAAQQALVADAAHELRTPIAALELQAGLLERARDDAARDEALAALRAGIRRSAHLVDQLLTLARSGAVDAPLQAERVDLAQLVAEVVAAMTPLVRSRGCRLALRVPPTAELTGDAGALHAMLHNLLANAIRHTPPGSRVAIELSDEGETLRLTVDDDGPGIPASERERVFDRFYRRDAGDAPGSGLGLAIVRAVVQRHGGTVALADSPLGGLRVVVALPRATA